MSQKAATYTRSTPSAAAPDASPPSHIAGWKLALGIASAILLAPVMGAIFGLFLLTALPIIPLMLPLALGFQSGMSRRAPPSSSARPTVGHLLPDPRAAHA
jgi:hypothetical protein